jgi:transposase
MQTVTTIGLDIAKSVFQVHGVDAAGQVVIRRQLKRRYVLAFFQKLPPCLIGIEACASSHYWSRELQALGHSVRLMPPAVRHQRSLDRTGGLNKGEFLAHRNVHRSEDETANPTIEGTG